MTSILLMTAILWGIWMTVVDDFNRHFYLIPDACATWFSQKYEPEEAFVRYAILLNAAPDSAEYTCTHFLRRERGQKLWAAKEQLP